MEESSKLKKCFVLFTTMMVLSACTFGGGFVIISMLQQKFVEKRHWLTEDEMMDMTAIAQCAPGSLAVNAAVVTGYRLSGTAGAVASALGAVIPPLIIISVIAVIYDMFRTNRYIAIALQVMRAGVAAVIFDVVITLGLNVIKSKKAFWIIMMIAAFAASWFFDVSAIVLIIISGAAGLLYEMGGRKSK